MTPERSNRTLAAENRFLNKRADLNWGSLLRHGEVIAPASEMERQGQQPPGLWEQGPLNWRGHGSAFPHFDFEAI